MVAPVSVGFDEDLMWVGLAEGRVIGVPLAWFPRLLNADASVREAFELSPFGIHWAGLNEDVSVAGLSTGRGC